MTGLLPLPRKIIEINGDCKIYDNMYIVLNRACTEDDFYPAESLKNEIEKISGFKVILEKEEAVDRGSGRTLRILTVAGMLAVRAIFPDVKKLPKRAFDQGYSLDVNGTVVLTAKTSRGFYYGIQTLKQLIYKNKKGAFIKGVQILDYPDFKYRGIMLDVSRGQVPGVSMLKSFIKRFSELKINMLNPYIEHTFRVKKHPLIGKFDGAYTAEEIKEIDEFAGKHHVELVGSFQAFGHQANILKLKKYEGLAETKEKWDLTPANGKTYDLIRDILNEMAPVFSSKLFNINSDETFSLGMGKSKALVEKYGKGKVYLSHIMKVKKMLDKHGKRTLMWADIVQQYPEELKNLSKNIIMLAWGYNKPIDLRKMRRLKRAGFEFIACPGTCASSKLIPEIKNSLLAQRGTIRNARKAKAIGVLCTEWGTQMGHDNLFGQDEYGFGNSADFSWSVSGFNKREKTFSSRCSKVIFGDNTGRTGTALEKFSLINDIFKSTVKKKFKNVSNFEWYNINRSLFYESSYPGHLALQLSKKDIRAFCAEAAKNENSMELASKNVTKNRNIWEEYMFSVRVHKYLSDKLRILYLNKPDLKGIKYLKDKVLELKKEHYRLWLNSSKKEGFRFTALRYDWQLETYNKMLQKSG